MKVVVIKCGGSTINELTPQFFQSLQNMQQAGYTPVFVHGGGPDINKMLNTLQIRSEFYNGLRKTTKEVMEVVEMVLVGKTNRNLAEKLKRYGFDAVGVNGTDSDCLQGTFINKRQLGYVGEITAVNKQYLLSFIENGHIPVITPIAVTKSGKKLNINADYAAAAIAAALQAEQCLFVTDVEGVIVNNDVVDELSINEINNHIENGTITGGMIPKVQSAISALEHGLNSARIVSGESPIFAQNQFLGTKICKRERVLLK